MLGFSRPFPDVPNNFSPSKAVDEEKIQPIKPAEISKVKFCILQESVHNQSFVHFLYIDLMD